MATDILKKLSVARAERVASVAPRALALRLGSHHTVSAIHWRDGFVVTASDVLRGADPLHVVGTKGTGRADFAGADTAIDVAVLKLDTTTVAASVPALPSAAPETGATIVVVGRASDGVLAAWGGVKLSGDAWTSQRGGHVDRRLELDVAFERRLEGALVVDTGGAAVGMAVPGPHGRVHALDRRGGDAEPMGRPRTAKRVEAPLR